MKTKLVLGCVIAVCGFLKATGEEIRPVPESESGIKVQGNRYLGKQMEGWAARLEKSKAIRDSLSAGETSMGKFIVPADLDDTLLNEYAKLQQLPPIESFFFGVPETVCLPDERQQVQDTTKTPYSINCQLVITMAGGQQAIGTGWLLGPRLVVTAGHCVHEGAGGAFFESVEVIPGMNGPVRPFGSQIAMKAQLRASDEWKTGGSMALDYGAIILSAPFQSQSGATPGNLSVQILPDASLNARNVFLSGYPGDKNFGSQWEDSDPIHGVESQRLRYMLDTFGGQSGSAVVPVGESFAVGIHNYGGCPNRCTRITTDVKENLDGWLVESGP